MFLFAEEGAHAQSSVPVNFRNLTVTVLIDAWYKHAEKLIVVDVKLKACHDILPKCFDPVPLFTNVTFDVSGASRAAKGCSKNSTWIDIPLPCGSNSTAYGKGKDGVGKSAHVSCPYDFVLSFVFLIRIYRYVAITNAVLI